MQGGDPLDPTLERIRLAVRHYHQDYLLAAELINDVFLKLGELEGYGLVDEVAQLIPESVQSELRRHVEDVLRPGAAYVPFIFGVPPEPEITAWRERMIPVCRRLALLFRECLAR